MEWGRKCAKWRHMGSSAWIRGESVMDWRGRNEWGCKVGVGICKVGEGKM